MLMWWHLSDKCPSMILLCVINISINVAGQMIYGDESSLIDDYYMCPRSLSQYVDSVDYLRLEDISIYSSIGDLSRECNNNDSMDYFDSLSIPTMIGRYFNRSNNIDIINANDDLLSLRDQTYQLVHQIRNQYSHYNVSMLWKLILILPGIADINYGHDDERRQTAVIVLDAIRFIYRRLPKRTMIVVLRMAHTDLWTQLSYADANCRHHLINTYHLSTMRNTTDEIWDQVTRISAQRFNSRYFSVQFLDLIPSFDQHHHRHRKQQFDRSLLCSYDCAHLSTIGINRLYSTIWNALLTHVYYRQVFSLKPVNMTSWRCPDASCPFIRTTKNSEQCIWTKRNATIIKQSSSDRIRSALLFACTFTVGTVLLLLVMVLCYSGRSQRPFIYVPYLQFVDKKSTIDIGTKRPFGVDIPNLRFIDDESASSRDSRIML